MIERASSWICDGNVLWMVCRTDEADADGSEISMLADFQVSL